SPKMVTILDESKYEQVKAALQGTDTQVSAGKNALQETAARPVDWVMAAIVGAAGIDPTRRAIENATTVALANKESIVCAGSLMIDHAKKHNTTILPVDSEHNAIFQVLHEPHRPQLEKITLTASGGPFRTKSKNDLKNVTV